MKKTYKDTVAYLGHNMFNRHMGGSMDLRFDGDVVRFIFGVTSEKLRKDVDTEFKRLCAIQGKKS